MKKYPDASGQRLPYKDFTTSSAIMWSSSSSDPMSLSELCRVQVVYDEPIVMKESDPEKSASDV